MFNPKRTCIIVNVQERHSMSEIAQSYFQKNKTVFLIVEAYTSPAILFNSLHKIYFIIY